MQKCFFLICPTDCLEYTINRTFKYENYFYTSLGNSFCNNNQTREQISQIIKKHNIEYVFFVLSKNNKIVLDALKDKQFSTIDTLSDFYDEIRKERNHSKISFQKSNRQFAILSYYLNKKIKELECQLTNVLNRPIQISGKIYNKDQDSFTNIYSGLVCIEKHHLN